MRIGLFTDTYPPHINGVATSTYMLKSALESLGHEVYVVTVNPDKMSYYYDELNRVLYVPGILVGIYNYRLSNGYPIGAISRVKKMKLDVIHSQQEYGVGLFAIAISKKYGIPLVHTYHTEYEEHIKYLSKGKCTNLTNYIVKRLAILFCDKTVDELIVPTNKMLNIFRNKYGITRNIYVIPTGIELNRFYEKRDVMKIKKELGLSNSFVLIYLGRIGFEKNIEFLICAHVKLNKKIKLLIVGDGPYTNNYKMLCQRLGLNDRVIFTGNVAWNDTPIYYQLADVFVLSSHSETQGITVIEAMASSLPVLCINDESFYNIVNDGINGFLFDDEDDYIKKINILFSDKALKKNMSIQAYMDSYKYSSLEFGKKVLEVYSSALCKGNFVTRIRRKVGK